ncbi:hypothetical protein BJX61DRAFT_261487 [Aspergillus egyptiacus]|nr:hypothetical protein BJX61DRAFT_261487 [Aspergillus egyptiacus]
MGIRFDYCMLCWGIILFDFLFYVHTYMSEDMYYFFRARVPACGGDRDMSGLVSGLRRIRHSYCLPLYGGERFYLFIGGGPRQVSHSRLKLNFIWTDS